MRWRGRGRSVCWRLLLQNKNMEIDENLLAYRGRGLCRILLWILLNKKEDKGSRN